MSNLNHEGSESAPGASEHRKPCALLVGGDASTETRVRTTATRCGIDLVVLPADETAKAAIVSRRFDVVLLATEDSQSLAPVVTRLAPATKTMVLSRRVSVGDVIEAMRFGAIDYVTLPFEDAEFGRRLLVAVERSRDEQEREDRVARLKRLCGQTEVPHDAIDREAERFVEEISTLRDETADGDAAAPHQDCACNDECATDEVREIDLAAEYRSLLRQELDLEELLRVGVEYLIGKTGATNAAVYLPSGDGVWSLGAYVNYDCPRKIAQPMLDRLALDLCPELSRQDDLMRFEDTAEFMDSLGLSDTVLATCDMVAWPCSFKGDCLAVYVLFRNREKGFSDELAGLIDTMRSIFAEQIATVLRIHHRATGGWPAESKDEDEESGWRDAA